MKISLRQQLKLKRRKLSPIERITAAKKLTDHCIHRSFFTQSQHIAAYFAYDNEIDPAAIIQHAWSLGKQVYLPILKDSALQFIEYTPSTQTIPNRYGIHEPASEIIFPAEKLDLVLLPLLGFDAAGNRLGSGKGYYDRTFAFLNKQPRPSKPLLIGLAYDFQQVDHLDAESWDVKLDEVITD